MDDSGAARLQAHKSEYSCVVVSSPPKLFLVQTFAAIMPLSPHHGPFSYVPLADKSSDVVACPARCWRLLAALASESDPERAGWWLACLPSNARERKDALSNAFDDAKRAAHSALWVRLADFAKNAAASGGPAVDVEVLAASTRRGADGSGAAASWPRRRTTTLRFATRARSRGGPSQGTPGARSKDLRGNQISDAPRHRRGVVSMV